jgi:hypothetical protein
MKSEKNEEEYWKTFNFQENRKLNLVILVVGSKNSGKSTIIQNISNQFNLRLIKKIKRNFYTVHQYIMKNIQYISLLKHFILTQIVNKDIKQQKTPKSKNSNKSKLETTNNTKLSMISNIDKNNRYLTDNENDSKFKKNMDENIKNLRNTLAYDNSNWKLESNYDQEENGDENYNNNNLDRIRENNSILNKDLYIGIEFREIESEELYSDYHMSEIFFENASVALVLSNFESNNSFIE